MNDPMKKKYIKPTLTKEKLSLNHFYDPRYVDSLPSLFGSFDVLAQSGCGGGSSSTNSHGCVCLLAGTPILLTSLKQVPIEKLKPNVKLYDGTSQGAQVSACYPHMRYDGYISFNNDLICCSFDHSFWVVNKNKYIEARKIQIDDYLINNKNEHIKIYSAEVIQKEVLVYNIELEVGKFHYYANNILTGTSKYFSHNREMAFSNLFM